MQQINQTQNSVYLKPLTILIPKHRKKLSSYRKEMIAYYAKELLKFGEFSSPEKALRASYMQISRNFPENLVTKGHYFFDICLHPSKKTIGYLWYEHHPKQSDACLMYIYIFSDQRSKGLGRYTMRVYEKLIFSKGITESVLYVFIKNTPAFNLYLTEGYYIDKNIKMFEGKTFTRYRMIKDLN